MAVTLQNVLHVRDHCLCLHTQRAARVLARRFDQAFRPFGLTNHQFSLMMALSAPRPAPLGLLAAMMGADRTTVTAALKPLIARGLAEDAPDPADRRVRRARLTDAGRELLAKAHPVWIAEHGRLEAELTGQAEPDALRSGLNAIAATVA